MQGAKLQSRQVSQAYRRIEEAIIRGEFKPGQRLIERDLERVLKISRTPIREALRQLEAVGLLETQANRGASVQDLSPGEVEDLYVVRLTLENLAIDLMQHHVTSKDLRALEILQSKMEQKFQVDDYSKLRDLNTQFHRMLTATTGNSILTLELEDLRRRTYVARHAFWRDDVSMDLSMRDHRDILEGIRGQDWSKVKRVVLEHVVRPARTYLAAMSRNGKRPVHDGARLDAVISRCLAVIGSRDAAI